MWLRNSTACDEIISINSTQLNSTQSCPFQPRHLQTCSTLSTTNRLFFCASRWRLITRWLESKTLERQTAKVGLQSKVARTKAGRSAGLYSRVILCSTLRPKPYVSNQCHTHTHTHTLSLSLLCLAAAQLIGSRMLTLCLGQCSNW
jgi:hypothetical protein